MDLGIAGKKALVCGASAGLGYACAQALVRDGVHVVIVARTEGPLVDAAARLAAVGGGQVDWVAADVTSTEGRARIFASHQDFDILITNAAGPAPGDFRQWDRATWHRAIDDNMLTPIELIKATVDGMMARGFGRIINIGSVVGKNAGNARPWIDAAEQQRAGNVAYGVSKAGIHAMTGFLAKELAAHGITVNAIAPGPIATPMTTSFPAQLKALIPAGRMGEAADITNAALFLAARESSFITGEILDVNGGMLCD